MTATITDRRDHYKDRSSGSRQRFIERYKKYIKESIDRNIKRAQGFTDLAKPGDKKIILNSKEIHEPHFEFDDYGGIKEKIFPGNDRFAKGDKILKPRDDGPGQGGTGAGTGEGDDSFTFILKEDEFTNLIFEDLELPNLVKENLNKSLVRELVYDGLVSEGPASQLNVLYSYRNSLGRRIGLNRKKHQKEIEELEAKLKKLEKGSTDYIETQHRIAFLKARVKAIPFFDKVDLRYRHSEWQNKPIINATMICIMDVSGSMGEEHKLLAKYFFYILYLFLKRKYLYTDVVFIMHTDQAKEVDEKTFFYSTENGGTIVMSALDLAYKVIMERFDPLSHNIYIAQAGDGDANKGDADDCAMFIQKKLLPITQYFIYSQISPDGRSNYYNHYDSQLWQAYDKVLGKEDLFDMIKLSHKRDIIPSFRKLFEKKE